MLRKGLATAAVFCSLAAPLALAAEGADPGLSDGREQSPPRSGICVNTSAGSQEVIKWATTESQCRNSSNGTMWFERGAVRPISQRGH